MSALPNRENRFYPFGYELYCVDLAVKSGNLDQKEVIARGFVTPDHRTIDGMGMVKYARKYGRESVAQIFIENGYRDEDWPHPPVA